jgi:hypothetical protein
MVWGFTWLLNFVNNFWSVLKNVGTWLIDGGIYAVKMALYGIVDGLLTVVTAIVAAINVSTLVSNMSADYGLLPPALVYVLNAICLPQGLSIIVAAIGIRMAINLIPAALTRI